MISFGHFTFVSKPKTVLIDFDNAIPPAIGTNVKLDTSNYIVHLHLKRNTYNIKMSVHTFSSAYKPYSKRLLLLGSVGKSSVAAVALGPRGKRNHSIR